MTWEMPRFHHKRIAVARPRIKTRKKLIKVSKRVMPMWIKIFPPGISSIKARTKRTGLLKINGSISHRRVAASHNAKNRIKIRIL